MERTVNYVHLLFASQLDEVNCIAGYADSQLWIVLWVLHSVHQLFTVKYVNIQMLSVVMEISVHHVYQVGLYGIPHLYQVP